MATKKTTKKITKKPTTRSTKAKAEGQEHDEEGHEATRPSRVTFAYRRERPARSNVERAGLLS